MYRAFPLMSAFLPALVALRSTFFCRSRRFSQKPGRYIWNRICCESVVAVELVLGRLAACCVRPAAAWHRMPLSGRTVVVAAYVGASYLTVLTLLLIAS